MTYAPGYNAIDLIPPENETALPEKEQSIMRCMQLAQHIGPTGCIKLRRLTQFTAQRCRYSRLRRDRAVNV